MAGGYRYESPLNTLLNALPQYATQLQKIRADKEAQKAIQEFRQKTLAEQIRQREVIEGERADADEWRLAQTSGIYRNRILPGFVEVTEEMLKNYPKLNAEEGAVIPRRLIADLRTGEHRRKVLEATTAPLYTITPADADTWAKDFSKAGEVISDDLAARLRTEYKDQIPIPPDVRRDLNIPPDVKTMSREQFMDYSLEKPSKELREKLEELSLALTTAEWKQHEETQKVAEEAQKIGKDIIITPSPIIESKENAEFEGKNGLLGYYLNPDIYEEESKDFNKRVKELSEFLSEVAALPPADRIPYSDIVSYGAKDLQKSLDATIEWIKKNISERRTISMNLMTRKAGYKVTQEVPGVKYESLPSINANERERKKAIFERQKQIDRINKRILLLYPGLAEIIGSKG